MFSIVKLSMLPTLFNASLLVLFVELNQRWSQEKSQNCNSLFRSKLPINFIS